MRKPRFNIASLLALIVVFGVGIAALREASDLWDNGLFNFVLGILLTSILLAIHRTDARRAFWLGFALFGWAYLGLALIPPIESRLITTKALARLGATAPRPIAAGLAYFDYDNDGQMDIYIANNSQPNTVYRNIGNGAFQDVSVAAGSKPASKLYNFLVGAAPPLTSGTSENFVRIGHSLFALVAALVGGQLSGFLRPKIRPEASGPVPL
jgi:hypothetical protein